MAEKFNAKDALADYVTVPQRIAQFYELFGQGRLVTGEVRVELGPDGKPRVMVQAAAYRTPDDTLPGIGWSWMELPGTTSFTRGSELENTETSAWGRAIASLGILVDRSVASVNEIRNKDDDDAGGAGVVPKTSPKEPPGMTREKAQELAEATEPVLIGPYSGTGKLLVRKSGPADGLLRQGPDGSFLLVAFADPEGHTVQVEVKGPLAADLYDAAEEKLNDLVCTIEGELYRVPWKKEGKAMPPYQRVNLARITTASWTLPQPVPPSVPMFDEGELDAVMERVP